MDDIAPRRLSPTRFWVGLLFLMASFFSLSTDALAAERGEHATWSPPEEARLLEELRAYAKSPLAIAPILDLYSLRDWMTTEQALRSTAEIEKIVQDPLAKAWARYDRLRLLLSLGRYEEAAALEKGFGFVDRWALAGPFRNDGMDGFDTVYPPEAEGYQGAEQRFDGKYSGLAWQEVERLSESGFLAASEHIADSLTATLYATAECEFNARDVEVQLAVDGAYKLWINETPVASRDVNLGGVFVRDITTVRAKRGWNRIFIKVATDRVEPGWHLRVVDRKGESAIRSCRIPEGESTPVAQPASFPQAETIAERLIAMEDGFSAADRVNAAFVLVALHSSDASEPWKHFLDTTSVQGLNPTLILRAARVQSQHWRAMNYLREIDVDAAGVEERLRMLYMRRSEIGFHAVLDFVRGVQELRDEYPQDPRPEMIWLMHVGGELRDLVVLPAMEELLEAYGPRPKLCEPLLNRLGSDYARAIRVAHGCAEREIQSLAAFKEYVTLLATTGQRDALRQAMASREAIWGHRSDWQRITQMVAGFDGDWNGVLASVDAEIAMRPNDAQSYVRRADALIRLGRSDEAAEALREAVTLRPQLRSAREQLAFLDAQEDKFYSPWRVGVEALRELQESQDLSQHDLGRVVDQRVVNVFPSGLATVYVQRAFTAASRAGADMVRSFQIGFSPDSEVVEIIAVRILRPDGTVRETFDTRDVKPYSGPSAIYYDVRTRVVSLPSLEAGDLVSLEYSISDVAYQNLFDDYFGDIWFLDSYYPTALARYVLYAPREREIFVELSGEKAPMVEREEGVNLVRIMEERDIAPLEREGRAPGAAEVFRYLHLSTYDDPDRMANWYWNLVREQLTTSPQMIAMVERLIDGVDNRREQVARIYEYVVRNTRYVGLEFGIHGFKPYRTTDCFDRKFGDCKDTASLLKVMLNIAKIDAELVLIRTRDLGALKPGYPSLALFNHAITYVPEFDLYLDGTAGFSGSQEMPGMDQGATALHILDGRGGRAVRTPYLSAELNVSEWQAKVDARASTMTGTMRARFIGGSAPSMRQSFEATDQQRETIERWAARLVPNIQVTSVQFNDLTKIEETVEFTAQTTGGQWLQARGDEQVLLPFGRAAFMLGEYAGASTRTLPLDLGEPSIEIVNFEIQLPANLEPQNMEQGEEQFEEAGVGRFTMRTHWDESARRLRVEGHLRWEAAQIAPEDYERFRRWAREIERAANSPFIFKEVQ